MAAPIALRGDFDAPGLRRLARQSKDAAQARRLLVLAEIYDGGSRTDAARIGGVTLQIVRDSGPIPAIHGVVRWRRKDLARWLFEAFRIAVDETTVGRALRALGCAKLSARPRHSAQNAGEREAFKKACLPRWRRSEPGCRTAPS